MIVNVLFSVWVVLVTDVRGLVTGDVGSFAISGVAYQGIYTKHECKHIP